MAAWGQGAATSDMVLGASPPASHLIWWDHASNSSTMLTGHHKTPQSSRVMGKELGERKGHTRTLVLPPQSSPLSPGPFYCKDRSVSLFFWREMEKEPGSSRPSLWAKHPICILLFDLHLEGGIEYGLSPDTILLFSLVKILLNSL